MLIPLIYWNYWFIFYKFLIQGIDRANDNVARRIWDTLQQGNIENNIIYIFLILCIKISFIINSYRICLYHIGYVIFGMRQKKI